MKNSLLQIFEKDFTQSFLKHEEDDFSIDFEFGEVVNSEVQDFEHEIKKIVKKSEARGEGTIVKTEGPKTTLITFLFFPQDCELKIDYL